jgi:hypothetical protein
MYSKIAALALPVLAAAYPQSAVVAPPADEITIRDTTYSGSGCPQGSVSTSTSDDKTVSAIVHPITQPPTNPKQVITWGFDSFQTYIGPDIKASEKSKNCQLHLNLAYPGGFQYAVVDATYHGWARLDEGVTGSFITTYYFSQDAGKTVRISLLPYFHNILSHSIHLANNPLLLHRRRRPHKRPGLHQAGQRRNHRHHLVALRQQRHPQHQQPHFAHEQEQQGYR